MTDNAQVSKTALWTGRVLKVLLILFMLFDSIMKMIKSDPSVKGTMNLGLPESSIQPLGIYMLLATILYGISKTSVTGAILATAYLGGAAAVTFMSHTAGHWYMFPVVFCMLMWIAEYMQGQRLRTLIPINHN